MSHLMHLKITEKILGLLIVAFFINMLIRVVQLPNYPYLNPIIFFGLIILLAIASAVRNKHEVEIFDHAMEKIFFDELKHGKAYARDNHHGYPVLLLNSMQIGKENSNRLGMIIILVVECKHEFTLTRRGELGTLTLGVFEKLVPEISSVAIDRQTIKTGGEFDYLFFAKDQENTVEILRANGLILRTLANSGVTKIGLGKATLNNKEGVQSPASPPLILLLGLFGPNEKVLGFIAKHTNSRKSPGTLTAFIENIGVEENIAERIRTIADNLAMLAHELEK